MSASINWALPKGARRVSHAQLRAAMSVQIIGVDEQKITHTVLIQFLDQCLDVTP